MYWNILFLATALSWAVPSLQETLSSADRLKEVTRVVERLQTDSGNTLSIEWNEATATPRSLTGHLTKPSNHSPQWISIQFLKKVKALYGLKRVHEQITVTSIEHDRLDRTKVLLQRQLYGKPVCGDELTVEMDKLGVIVRVDGTVHSELERKRLNRPMYPAITGSEAAEKAFRYTGSQYPADKTRVHACYLPIREGIPLIYVVTFVSDQKGSPSRPVYVHSITGRIIE